MKYGAVRYLNMLPYYFDDPSIHLFDTPAQLNAAMRAGDLDAGCMSAVEALKSGFVMADCGIAAKLGCTVESVFVETISRPKVTSPRSDRLFVHTTGASEHSQWLFESLFTALGYKVTIVAVKTSMDSKNTIESFPADRHESLLIGDNALLQRSLFPNNPRMYLSDMWQEQTTHQCVFANWASNGAVSFDRIVDNAKRWHQLSRKCRLPFIDSFRQSQKSLKPLSNDFLTDYLDTIQYLFSADHILTLAAYKKMLT